MWNTPRHAGRWWPVLAAAVLLVALTGCDPTLQATVEDGVISLSTSFFGALLRAAFELAGETNTTNTTAMIVTDLAGRVLA